MPCKCTKTRCLKQYCVCFQAGVPCTSECQCLHCDNKDGCMKRIEVMNKMKSHSNTVFTPSHLTRAGCSCPRSGCVKKYCVCYKGGIRCTRACRCTGCKNCTNELVPPEISLELPIKDTEDPDPGFLIALDEPKYQLLT